MKLFALAGRTGKEILRDPLNLAFGLGFPVILLLLFHAIQKNAPVELFQIQNITPGMIVFGLAFMTLFSAMLIAKDRSSALLQRLYTTPLTAMDFILGYTVPVLPMALGQTVVCLAVAVVMGLPVNGYLLLAVLMMIPAALFFIALGLLCGSLFTDKQVGGICGALLTNLTAWLSGAWFDLELVGGAFQKIANLLPFVHCVKLERAALQGNFGGMLPHFWWVLGYMFLAAVAAVLVFLRNMRRQ